MVARGMAIPAIVWDQVVRWVVIVTTKGAVGISGGECNGILPATILSIMHRIVILMGML
jgi:hypothetical protein